MLIKTSCVINNNYIEYSLSIVTSLFVIILSFGKFNLIFLPFQLSEKISPTCNYFLNE